MLALELPTSTRFASPSPTARAVPLAHRCAPHGGAVGRFGRFGRFAREDWTRAAGVVLLGAMASRKAGCSWLLSGAWGEGGEGSLGVRDAPWS